MAKRNLPNMETGEAEVNVTPNEVTDTAETIEPVIEEPKKEAKTGVVANCVALNVRQKPNLNAKVVCIINKDTVITIDKKASNKEWFKVTLDNGVEGFCMKKFIQIDS